MRHSKRTENFDLILTFTKHILRVMFEQVIFKQKIKVKSSEFYLIHNLFVTV